MQVETDALDGTVCTHHTVQQEVYVMRTNIDLDDALIKEALRFAQVRTKRELVNLALREFVAMHRRKDLRELRGRVKFRAKYDHKSLRAGVA